MPAKIEGGIGPRLPGGGLRAEVGEIDSRLSPKPIAGVGDPALLDVIPARVGDAGDVPGRDDDPVDMGAPLGMLSLRAPGAPRDEEEPDCGIEGREDASVEAEFRLRDRLARSLPSWTAL